MCNTWLCGVIIEMNLKSMCTGGLVGHCAIANAWTEFTACTLYHPFLQDAINACGQQGRRGCDVMCFLVGPLRSWVIVAFVLVCQLFLFWLFLLKCCQCLLDMLDSPRWSLPKWFPPEGRTMEKQLLLLWRGCQGQTGLSFNQEFQWRIGMTLPEVGFAL